MDTEEIKLNPYAPPGTSAPATKRVRHEADRTRPIVPAVIGLFTYGSSSPYALVLCIEQYLLWARSSIPWSTHIAMVLSIFGTMGWIELNLLCFSESMFAGLGLYVWSASVAFLIWLIWRIVLFQRKSAENAMGIGSIALTWLLQQDQGKKPKAIALAKPHNDLLPRKPQIEPKAKAMISLFQHGGPRTSHLSLCWSRFPFNGRCRPSCERHYLLGKHS